MYVRLGNIKTDLGRHMPSFTYKLMVQQHPSLPVLFSPLTTAVRSSPESSIQELTILYPAPQGALTQLYAGTMPEALNYNGEVRLRPIYLPFLSAGLRTNVVCARTCTVPDPLGPAGQVQARVLRRRDRGAALDVARGRGQAAPWLTTRVGRTVYSSR